MKISLTLGAILLAAAAISAQQDKPVFRTGANIVTLDVTVVDKDGKPVKGLKAEDFEITLEGQKRPVQTVDFVEFGSGSSARAAAPSGSAASSSAIPTGPARRVVVFLFDDQSLTPLTGRSLTIAASRALDVFGPNDLIGVTSISGLLPTVNPTTDHELVKATITKLVGRADVSPTPPFYISAVEAAEIDRGIPTDTLGKVAARECPEAGMDGQMMDACSSMIAGLARGYNTDLRNRAAIQMEAYKQVIEKVKAFAGAKVVITMSGGVPTIADTGAIQRQLEPIMREAADSSVRFYAMAEEPEMADARDTGPERGKARVLEGRTLFDGLASVAAAAGGEAFHVIGQGDRFLTRIEQETSAIYRLGVDAPQGADKVRFLNAKVSVKKPGITVRATPKALAADAARELIPVDKQLMNAVAGGGVDVAVPITLGASLRRNPQTAQLELGVSLQLPNGVAGPVTTLFSLVDSTGKSVLAGKKALAPPPAGQDYRFSFALAPPAPGRYSLRVSAADANGRVGSNEQRVDAVLGRIGPFATSQLLIGWTGADKMQRLLAYDAVPAEATALQASLELYADDEAAMRSDVVMHFAITPIGSTKPVLEKDIHPVANSLTLASLLDFDASVLKPGSYTVTATVMQSGASKGMLQTLLRKR